MQCMRFLVVFVIVSSVLVAFTSVFELRLVISCCICESLLPVRLSKGEGTCHISTNTCKVCVSLIQKLSDALKY